MGGNLGVIATQYTLLRLLAKGLMRIETPKSGQICAAY